MAVPFSLSITTRLAKATELPFVLKSFTGTVHRMRFTESADRKDLTQGGRLWIAQAFASPGCQVWVAEVASTPDVLPGFVVTSEHEGDTCLLFAYTKSVYRKAGVCRQLMASVFGDGGYPRYFGLYHGSFGGHLRRKGVVYCPFASMLLGGPSEEARNLLEM